jgi:hypothetical protein
MLLCEHDERLHGALHPGIYYGEQFGRLGAIEAGDGREDSWIAEVWGEWC